MKNELRAIVRHFEFATVVCLMCKFNIFLKYLSTALTTAKLSVMLVGFVFRHYYCFYVELQCLNTIKHDSSLAGELTV